MKIPTQRGFTLVETMVALGIFVIVTAIVFVGNSRFNNTIFLTNLAYDLALTVSRAQSYGINVRPFDGATKPFEVGYGVYFEKNSHDSFILFTDVNQNNLYSNNELLERYIIRRGNYISNLFCGGSPFDSINITFIRPNPDAIFYCNGISSNASSVRIEVTSPAGIKKNVTIEATGQISVQ